MLGSITCAPQARGLTPAVPSVAASDDRGSAQVAGAAKQRALDVPGFLPAVLFSPAGSQPRPLVVATHGAGGTPEWACQQWRQLTRERSFVLCLRGKSMGGGGYYYPDHRALEAELKAAERAARAAEPRLLAGSGVYTGFSQGASMGSVMLPAHGARFPYLVLTEGFELWSVARAKSFKKSGGKRVLLACGSKQCEMTAKQSVRWLEQGGVEARLEYASGAGHTPGGDVERALSRALPWLVRADPAFALDAE